MFNSVSQSFVAELEAEISRCISENSKYKPSVVRFTCNFFLLVNKFSEIKRCYSKFFSNNHRIQNLVRHIGRDLMDAEYKAIKLCIFVKLKNWKELEHFSCNNYRVSATLSCEVYLQGMYKFLHKAFYLSHLDADNSSIEEEEKKNILNLTQEICLLIQNCMGIFEVSEKLDESNSFCKEEERKLCLKNFTYSVEDDFINNLKNQMVNQVKINSNYNPNAVRFTYSFLLLMRKWDEIQGYCNNSIEFESLMAFMDTSFISIKKSADIGGMFVQLKYQEPIKLYPSDVNNIFVAMGCLEERYVKIHENSKILGDADSDLRRMRIFILTKEMCVLIQTCINTMELNRKKFGVSSAQFGINGYQQIRNYIASTHLTITNDFAMTLPISIDYYVRANPNYPSQALQFTFVFSLLQDYWSSVMLYYNEVIITNNGFGRLKSLIEFIDENLLSVRLSAAQICMFVDINNSAADDGYLHKVCTSKYVTSLCKTQLETVHGHIREAFDISGNSIFVENARVRICSVTHNMCMLIHYCLESFKPIEERSIDSSPMVILYPEINDDIKKGLNNQSKIYVQDKPEYSVNIAKFSFSFHSLDLEWPKILRHYNKVIKGNNSFIKLKHLVKIMGGNLSITSKSVRKLGILIDQECEIEPGNHDYLFTSCKQSFRDIDNSIKCAYDLLSSFDFEDVERTEIFNLTQGISLIMCNCITYIQLIKDSRESANFDEIDSTLDCVAAVPLRGYLQK